MDFSLGVLLMTIYVVLAGGLAADGKLAPWTWQRVELAASLAVPEDTVIFSSRYTLNAPPKLSLRGFPVSEAQVMSKLFKVLCSGFPRVYLENSSTDTVGSAAFCRLLFLERISDPETDIAIITSDFHRDRSEYLFRMVLNLEPKVEYREIRLLHTPCSEATLERNKKEREAFIAIKDVFRGINNMDQFLYWLTTEHDNYNTTYRSRAELTEEFMY